LTWRNLQLVSISPPFPTGIASLLFHGTEDGHIKLNAACLVVVGV